MLKTCMITVFVFSIAMLQAMDKNVSNESIIGLSAARQFKTQEQVIQDYFLGPKRAMRWFNLADDVLTEIKLSQSRQDEFIFLSCENKAEQYRQMFMEYGICNYACDKGTCAVGDSHCIFAGFLNGSIVMRYLLGGKYVVNLITPSSELQALPCFGHAVTAVTFINTDPYVLDEKVLIGYGDGSLVGRIPSEKGGSEYFTLGKMPKPITSIIKGHLPNTWVVSGGEYVAMLLYDKPMFKLKAWSVDSQITGLALCGCGVVVRTVKDCAIFMPYPSNVHDALEACSFSIKQKACMVRLIAAIKLGMKAEVQESEKECFAALPNVLQKMLLE